MVLFLWLSLPLSLSLWLSLTLPPLPLTPSLHAPLSPTTPAFPFLFPRYAMLVSPINYMLCSVNIALFGSSAWHLGRKIKADYVD